MIDSIVRWVGVAALGCTLWTIPTSLFAGLSSENVVIVVNADSIESRTVANHYVHDRNIPTANVILLTEVPDKLKVSMEEFKTKILKPILEAVNKRGLAPQVRCIAYSVGFPTCVDITPLQNKATAPTARNIIGTAASITGLTYLYQFVLSDSDGFLSTRSNRFVRDKFERHFMNPFANERQTQFQKANQSFEADPAKSAAEFQTLFKEFPTIAPLAIRSAEAFSKAGDLPAATKMLKQAIKAGWWSGAYLGESEYLKPLLADDELKKAQPLMANYPTHVQGPRAFTSRLGWTECGSPVRIDQGGMPYLMSCSLGVINHFGNNLRETIEVLERASKADRTFPPGDFRFAGGTDVRATTRFPGVGDALLFLQNEGFKTDVFRGAAPAKPGDVAGMLVGVAGISFKNTRWKLAPGSISESLTSLGGDFTNGSQTKLTEFLLGGAAMSSGAVVEPYALQFKFPLPMMYAYYATGVSAMEAFYLSVASPYQLLIAGDPLCQPFARAPAEWINISFTNTNPPKVSVRRNKLGNTDRSTRTGVMEVYVEGKLVKEMPAPAFVDMNLPADTSGALEVRVVISGVDATEPRLSFAQQLDTQGKLPTPTATITQPRQPSTGLGDDGAESAPITFQLQCDGADQIDLLHFGKVVGSLKSSKGSVKIETKTLGGGPLRFRPVATFGERKILGFSVVDGAKE